MSAQFIITRNDPIFTRGHWMLAHVPQSRPDADQSLVSHQYLEKYRASLAGQEPQRKFRIEPYRMPRLKLSPWQVDPEAAYCCMRIREGGDPLNVADRVAFIEKTPRVRFRPFSDQDTDGDNWFQGPKGSGGADGHDPANELYGFYPPSRSWCDTMLLRLNFELL